MTTLVFRGATQTARAATLLIVVSLVAVVGQTDEEPVPAPVPEVSRLAIWLAGEFDNWQQVSASTSDEADRTPGRLHSTVVPVDLPALGDHTLYVQQYENGNPDNIVRQRIYSLRPDEAAGAVAMTAYSFRNPDEVRDAHLDPSKLEGLDIDQVDRYEGCDVMWRADGDGFAGTSSEVGCEVASAQGMIVVFHSRYRLDRHLLLSREWGTNEFDEPLWRSVEDDPVRLRRCRLFRGLIAISGDDGEEHIDRNLEMHDQGGTLEISDDLGNASGRVLRLESIGGNAVSTSTLRLSILEPGDNGLETTGFASADSSAGSIGLEIDGIRAEFSIARSSSADLNLLASWMTGSFSNAAQAEDNEAFSDISLHTAAIWPNRPDGRWFYVEQAVSEQPDRPYRQRVYRLRELADDRIENQIFTLPDPGSAVGAWQEEAPLADLDPSDLEERQGCSIFFRRRGDTFEGSTLASLCTSTVRGATFATSEVVITPGGLVSWDRGFDFEGSQVWGATEGGHVFDRLVFQSEAEAETASGPESESVSVSASESASETVPVPGDDTSGNESESDQGQTSRDDVRPHHQPGE